MRDAVGPIHQVAEAAHAALARKNKAREAALGRCRDAIRHSANGIRAVHRGEFDAARGLIDKAGNLLAEAKAALAQDMDIFFAGFVHDAQKEYTEASLTLAIVDAENQKIPRPEDLDVELAAYLNGMAE